MRRRHWTVSTEVSGRPRKIEVYIYDTESAMHGAATRHSNEWDKELNSFEGSLGVTHAFRRISIAEDGSESEDPQAGIIRFVKGHCTPEIVSHEVAHIVQWLYALDGLGEYEGDLAVAPPILSDVVEDHFTSANERFAYMFGAIFSTVWALTREER